MNVTLQELMSMLKTAYEFGRNSKKCEDALDDVLDEIIHDHVNDKGRFVTFVGRIGDGLTPNKNGDIYPPMSYEVTLPSGEVMHMFDVAPPIIVGKPKKETDNWDQSWGE